MFWPSLFVGTCLQIAAPTSTDDRTSTREANPPRPGYSPLYALARGLLQAMFIPLYRLRVFGLENIPKQGALLIVANHQSYLDPPVIGTAIRTRQLDYIARSGLFDHPLVAKVISTFNSIPIKEEGGDAAAIKEVLRRLEAGRAVLIFPEGTRTPDGAMRPFKRGVAVLVKRSRCPVVPVAIEGAFDAWPRDQGAPKLLGQRLAVMVGRPIPHEELMANGADAALTRLQEEIEHMRMLLRTQLRQETHGRLPAHGPGDHEAFGHDSSLADGV
jgi:1-acyl-sn-glycerol-3-phosphate acyltransferase